MVRERATQGKGEGLQKVMENVTQSKGIGLRKVKGEGYTR